MAQLKFSRDAFENIVTPEPRGRAEILNLGFFGLVRANILNGTETHNFAQLTLDIPSKVRFKER
ncbi:hypothetical protein N7467_009946 [Penicillium canescens]|nr:hypothetical protein N7467_009946 [Penicillium canescens]